MRAIAFLLALAGCSRAPRLYGEVHVHQFPGGSHPAALFLAAGVPPVTGDTVVPDAAPLASAGGCDLFTPDRPPPAITAPVDGGAVHIRGGRLAGAVDLRWGRRSGYLAQPPFVPGTTVFAGGEPLEFSGDGATAPAFHGTLRAPMPLELRAPDRLERLAGLVIEWVPGTAERVLVTAIASTSDGRFAVLKCVASDGAGRVTLPASLVERMPPPPRDLQLEVRRDAIGRAPPGIILHASWALRLTGQESQ
jgi:hypothetical protein